MATADTAARNSRASDFATDYAAATLTFLDGATPLVVHSVAGFTGVTNPLTTNAIADATILASGVCDSATWSDTSGTYTLTVGTVGSGADVEISSLTFTLSETSSVNSGSIEFPA